MRLRFLLIALFVTSWLGGLAPSLTPTLARAETRPTGSPGFTQTTVFSGLNHPTVVRFASDGRVFIAEKSGLIKVFDNLTATAPTTFADLRVNVHNYWDRGLLGLALDPNFPTQPYVYVLYTYNHILGDAATPPRWPTSDGTSDSCPTPPGPTTDGCVVSGRLSRLTASFQGGSWVMTGNEQPLIEDWCQQFPSHSIGTLAFGPDGALYVSAGDGASFNNADWGQFGGTLSNTPTPKNPCGDPPNDAMTPPTAEGGALRSQSLQRPTNEPVTLNGAILRVDPATGAGWPGNPYYDSANPNANRGRIIGYGLRNPFRMTVRPQASELWIGDVGWNTYEEIERLDNPAATTPKNFGWPCYEGNGKQPSYDNANLNLCKSLYSAGSASVPFFAYQHGQKVVPGEACLPSQTTDPGSSIAGLAFYTGIAYPTKYQGALFFADYSRGCIWVMPTTSGQPDPGKIETFVGPANGPVDLEVGPEPEKDLFYVDYNGGKIWRIQYNAPTAKIQTIPSPPNGNAPLTVQFNGTGSTPGIAGETLTYDWDLNGDGVYGDSNSATPSYTYSQPGTYTARLKVTDPQGVFSIDSMQVNAGNTPPRPVIDTPAGTLASTLTWKVGDTINFLGHADDDQAPNGKLPASALTWSLIIHHCPSGPSSCHTHSVQDFAGVASGSFSTPDHEYPCYLELKLTATDSGGLQTSTSVQLEPKPVDLTFQSIPTGLQIAAGTGNGPAPFTQTVIVGSINSVGAKTQQTLNGATYQFVSWSDGGAQAHSITAGTSNTTYTATFNGVPKVTSPGNQSSAEGQAVSLQIAASDPEASPLTYSAAGLPPGLSINSTTGRIAGTLTYSAAGRHAVTVTVSDGTSSSSATFTWTVSDANPKPTITRLSLAAPSTPGANATLTVEGTGFVPGSRVYWNEVALETTYLNGEKLQAVVPAASLSVSGAVLITVVNPAPGGGASNAMPLPSSPGPVVGPRAYLPLA